MQDAELLREYARTGSETAFAELVKRYVDFVFAMARRQLGDPHLAEEVTQSVFCLLAQKAGGLTGQVTLAGWLYRATSYIATRTRRTEQRRRQREQDAIQMNVNEANVDDVWARIAPLLDEALKQLGERDRVAVLVRFFQGKPMREVGETLGVSEAAAKMRVSRAVEQLRGYFAKRGVTCTAAAVGVALTERAVEAAPLALASGVSAAVASGAAASSLSLVQLMILMARVKMKALMATGLAVLVVGTASWSVYESQQAGARRASAAGLAGGGATQADATQKSGDTFFSKAKVKAATDYDPTEMEEAIAKLRAALHNTNSKVSPGEDVVAAVQRFGRHGAIAFKVLKAEAGAHDEAIASYEDSERAPHRAVMGMGFLEKTVPGVVAHLWEIYGSTTNRASDSIAFNALAALSQLGFEPSDIPTLTDRVLRDLSGTDDEGFVCHQVAEWIAKVIQENPEAAQSYVARLQTALSDTNSGVRFWAACALMQSQGLEHPEIFEEIAAGLKNGDKGRLSWVSQLLKSVGAVARPIVPALVEAAQLTDDANAKEWGLLAAGKIAGELRESDPQVDAAVRRDEAEQAWLDKINSGTATLSDLVNALKEPTRVTGKARMAAEVLGAMGAAASNAVPDLIAVLRERPKLDGWLEVYDAVLKIDPKAPIVRMDMIPLLTVMEEVMNELPSQQREPLAEFLTAEQFGLKITKEDIAAFATKLAATNEVVYRAYAKTVTEQQPGLKELFQR